MKTALLLGTLLIAGSALALVPSASALDCTNVQDAVNCQLQRSWFTCDGETYYRGDRVAAHPDEFAASCL